MPSVAISNENAQYTHDIYAAIILDYGKKKKLFIKAKNGNTCSKFSKPVTDNHLSKVYIIKNRSGTIIYVGKTTQSITTRLRSGLNPKHDTGYHGYHWQDKEEIFIHCITVESFSNSDIEATEAEIVYLYRNQKNKWPDYQTEIHFANNQKAKVMAEEIMNVVEKNLTIAST